MYLQVTDTEGNPCRCVLREGGSDGSYARCRATKDWCILRSPPGHCKNEVEGMVCPWDKHDVVQLEYRKKKMSEEDEKELTCRWSYMSV